jgi:hypothetical protein
MAIHQEAGHLCRYDRDSTRKFRCGKSALVASERNMGFSVGDPAAFENSA